MISRAEISLRPLASGEIPALAALETAAWPESLRAGEALIRERLARGHGVHVAAAADRLAAAVSYVETAEEPFDRARFPRDFAAFSALPRSAPVRSLYVYNLCVHPDYRGGDVVRRLVQAGVAGAHAAGARWLVGDGRCPSYAGSEIEGAENIPADPAFRAAIDSWAATGVQPRSEALIRDPVLRFYRRVLGCRFLHLIPNFFPGDSSSGGFRVILVKDLKEDLGGPP